MKKNNQMNSTLFNNRKKKLYDKNTAKKLINN